MVSRLCADLGLPHEVLAAKVAPGNLQHNARAARYAALGEWAARRGLAALATGHQLDDQAETLVMRLNRGSGLAGLAGVRARGLAPGVGICLLRPLLGWRRAELAAITAAAGLEAAQDSSNADDRFDRARIRKALAEADWLDAEGLARSASLLGEAETYLAERLDAVWKERVRREGGAIRFSPGPSDFEAGEIARRILRALGGEPRRSEAAALVARLRRGENASLAGVLARVRGDEWIFILEPSRSS